MNEPIKFNPISTINLKGHPEINESLIQKILAENPSLLGLGSSVEVRDKERRQPAGGRLDLLLQDSVSDTRYEVEVQLGETDETHIIRTIEYWDIERKRYPQYDHVAVIVAEEITSRFFNVISLFNRSIPLIALKMTAVKHPDDSFGLLFTRVLNLATPDVEEDDQPSEITDRAYWEKRSSKDILRSTEQWLKDIQAFEPKAEFSYNKYYLGIWVAGKANNFVVFRPKRNYYYIDIKMPRSSEIDELIANSDFEELRYTREGRYSLRLNAKVTENQHEVAKKLLQMAY